MPDAVQLIKETVIPQLSEISNKMEKILISHAKTENELQNFKDNTQEKFQTLRCSDHETSFTRLVERVRLMDVRVKENTKQNRDQEKRYEMIISRFWKLVFGVLTAASLSFGSHFIEWKKPAAKTSSLIYTEKEEVNTSIKR